MSVVKKDFHRRKKLRASRVYTSREVTGMLGIKREDVLHLLNNEYLKGQKVDGQYRIKGTNIAFYLQKLYKAIHPTRIYNSQETARLLKVERSNVLKLIAAGTLKGHLANRNYRISGKSIQEYLRRWSL